MARPKTQLLPLLILSLLCISQYAWPQQELNFKPINVISNLPTNEIRNLFQDSEGYIWISTYNGLVRYDGYSTLVFKPNNNNDGKSIDGFINIVTEDKEGKLWIGTHNGLYMFDKRKGVIEKILSPGLQVNYIEAIVCASNGDLWVGTQKGVYLRKNGEKNFELCEAPEERVAIYTDIKSIIEDKDGQIWIGTWAQGLIRYNPTEKRFYNYYNLNPAHSSHIIFQDQAGNIWVGTWRYGLMKLVNPYDMEHYSVIRYLHEENRPNSLSDNIIYAISQDRNTGKIWIGSRSGLSILESEEGGGRFQNFLPGEEHNNLPFNEVDALLYSRDGLMWVGMLGGGVYTVNTRKQQFAHDPLHKLRKLFPTSSVRSIYQCTDGKLWMGIMGFGLVLYDEATGETTYYQQHPAFKHLPYISTVNDIIYSERTGEYIFATWDDGVWLYDGKRVRVINEKNYPALTDICIYSLKEDSKGNLWIGARSGLFMLDTDNKLHSLNELSPNSTRAFPQTSIFKIVEDHEGNIWVATVSSGIWRISCKEGKYSVKMYNNEQQNNSIGAMTLCVDSYDRLWVGTNGNGLSLYNKGQDRFVPMFSSQFDSGEVIFSLIEDDDKTLWLTTNAEMYHINLPVDGSNPIVHTYTIEDGLQSHIFNRNACHKSNDGQLFFGGANGLNKFYPKDITFDNTSYPVVITDLKIHNVSIRDIAGDEREKITATPLDYARKITLSHDQNNFRLDFSLLNYINPKLNKYEYQLEGYDKDWMSTNAQQRFAYYNNLPAGTYQFIVRGANANGTWSENIRTLQITILPPPWQSWWAFCIYTLLLAAIMLYLYHAVQNRMRMKQAIELGKLQRQKLEEVNHAKLQFFTNITHELLTPLSVIQASVEELNLQYPRMKSQLRGISENTMRLIRLIQQILEFRKVENAKQKLRVSKGNITLFIKRSVMAFTPLVRKKKLRIILENFDEQFIGYFDSDKLDKILYNLLSNAAKYTHEGDTITLKQYYDPTTTRYTFSVNNPGEPIPEEKKAHLFERFYEGEYRKFRTVGTGIGLSLTKDLVDLHHGIIDVTSSQEDGITFTVELPLGRTYFSNEEVDEENEALNNKLDTDFECPEDDDEIATDDSTQPAAPDRNTRILLVEDNEELRKSMSRMLAAHFQVQEAANGQDAWERVEKEGTDLVVTDVMMPGIDGLELCKRLKGTFETAHIPVILITARISDNERVEGYEAGADGYICKPLKMSVLVAKINNLLKRQEQGRKSDARKKLVFEAKEVDYTPQDEAFLKKALDVVNKHLDDQDFDTTTFISEMGMARTSFNEKMKQLAGVTPAVFISNVRLQAAFKLVQEKKKIRISDLAYAVGFNDPKYFSLCFRKKFGISPKDMKSEGDKSMDD